MEKKMFGMPDIPDFKGLVSAGIDASISFGGGALINTLFGNYWGIFNEYGIPILLADNVLSLQYQNKSSISHAPIEKGSFTSYNKVADPFKATVQFSKSSGGTLERGAFLAQIEILAKSTLKFYIITPEYVYKNVNITGFDYAREASDGATLLKINVSLEEIREVTFSYSTEDVTNPEDSKTVESGDKTNQVEANTSGVDSATGGLFSTLGDIGDAISNGNGLWDKVGGASLAVMKGVKGAYDGIANSGVGNMISQTTGMP